VRERRRGGAGRRTHVARPSPAALVLWIGSAVALAAACGSDSAGPEPVSIRFKNQPQNVVAGEVIRPAVEVGVEGAPESVRVGLSISGNLCGASLAGAASRSAIDGVATFPDLSIDVPADGYRIEARVLDAGVTSVPFDVRPPPRTGPVELLPFVCDRANAHGDAAALAWVPEQDLFWLADDNFRQIYSLDRRTGDLVRAIGRQAILDAFPSAADCDDGDGDPATTCSFVDELEVVAFDARSRRLFVFNTVNDPGVVPPVDRGAVFRLGVGACRGCLVFEAWKPIPAGFTYRAAVVIDGEIYIANGQSLHRFDFDAGIVETEAAVTVPHTVTGLAYRDGILYVLTRARTLFLYGGASLELLGTWDLASTGLVSPAGVEAVRDTVYVVEGEPPNPIFALRLHPNED